MEPGIFVDIEAPKPDGTHWDFSDDSDVAECFRGVEREHPYLLIWSPPRVAFHLRQGGTCQRGPAVLAKAMDVSRKHMWASCENYRQHVARSR
eukprot:1370760-Pyramimonas_sp.AAC.1